MRAGTHAVSRAHEVFERILLDVEGVGDVYASMDRYMGAAQVCVCV